MTNTILLKERIKKSGLKQKFIYETLGLSKSQWFDRMKGAKEFEVSEIQGLCKVLGITSLKEKENIFFSLM